MLLDMIQTQVRNKKKYDECLEPLDLFLPLSENCYDKYNDCPHQMERDKSFCSSDHGFEGCHKSCGFCSRGMSGKLWAWLVMQVMGVACHVNRGLGMSGKLWTWHVRWVVGVVFLHKWKDDFDIFR